ncbi:MAG: GTPase HflX [Candidatus Aminicenantes bacterium]|nr:GTPase HflX [Candidatus Aminicenantes bacterium]
MKYYRTQKEQELVVLVGLSRKPGNKRETESHLKELALLTETAGGKPVKRFLQQLNRPHPATFVGRGMLDNIAGYVKENDIDTVIFDDELSPSQLRNIETVLQCKILDRTNLILDIFAGRAQTAHARIQVELAQYNYLLPRLKRMWTHLERQQGGIGLRGPGEREIETDRRIIRKKITRLKRELQRIDKQKSTQRRNRGRLVRVALVGYTNAGKSTILNLLSKSRVLTENKLFATLDTTVRRMVIKNLPFLLADTVGFIHKLPHFLVESFKATLDEVREADLLLHVIDIAHPDFEAQIRVVSSTLREIGAGDKPVFTIFNKIDITNGSGAEENKTHPPIPAPPALNGETSIYISAVEKINIDMLRQELYERVKEIHITRYPYNDFLFTSFDIP